jgi:hypothetical protein
VSRALLVAAAIPIAILLNGVRVFLTGFLVYFVDPKLGEGFMHLTEGWMIFVVAFALLGGVSWLLGWVEERGWTRWRSSDDGLGRRGQRGARAAALGLRPHLPRDVARSADPWITSRATTPPPSWPSAAS